MVSIWVFGMLVGVIVFGYFVDCYGCKCLFFVMLFWYVCFSVVIVLLWNYELFLFFCVMMVLVVGGEYLVVIVMMGEFILMCYCGWIDVLILLGFLVGVLLLVVVLYLVLN